MWGDRSGNVCVFCSDITDATYSSRQTGGLLDKNGTTSLPILRTNVLRNITYYAFYISQTIIGMEFTEQMTD